jgi:hypothetical protein
MTGLEVEGGGVQVNKINRTGKQSDHRLAFRPVFAGPVQEGMDYILVDDVFSNGGSFSELRSYIEDYGGNVVSVFSFATGGHGNKIGLTSETMLELERKYGVESLKSFLQEVGLYGGNYNALTEPEAYALLRATSLDEARDRILDARQAGNARVFPENGSQDSGRNEYEEVDPVPQSYHPINCIDLGVPIESATAKELLDEVDPDFYYVMV